MNTKTMEGLVGARTNVNLLNTPFRVYKEARRKDSIGTMERAMEYVNKFSDKADEYKAQADKGMKEDAETARKQAKSEREKAIQKRKEEREKLEERIEEGRVSLKENCKTDCNDAKNTDVAWDIPAKEKTDKSPAAYTKVGEAGQPEQGVHISVSV